MITSLSYLKGDGALDIVVELLLNPITTCTPEALTFDATEGSRCRGSGHMDAALHLYV